MHFITFSRRYGAGGGQIAKKVAEKTGYKFYDTDAIEYKAGELGFREDIEEIAERPPSFFQRIFSSKPSVDLDRLNSVVYELAKQGDAVFLGWGSHMLLRAFDCALHVRVIASREKRIQNLIGRGMSAEDASSLIDRTDHDREAFIKFAFGVDWDDPDLYDLVINMDKLSLDLAVETVVRVARSEEIKACSIDAMRQIENMALKSRLEAAIMEAGLAYGHTISISIEVPEPGVAHLSGFVEDQASLDKAQKVVESVPGVRKLVNYLKVVPATRYS
ncbi:MAG: cytidylate kinase family protein [Thermodesulfobacteriota bacterium]